MMKQSHTRQILTFKHVKNLKYFVNKLASYKKKLNIRQMKISWKLSKKIIPFIHFKKNDLEIVMIVFGTVPKVDHPVDLPGIAAQSKVSDFQEVDFLYILFD